jgi:hypothetical protein
MRLFCFSLLVYGTCGTIQDRKMTGGCLSDLGGDYEMDRISARAAVSRLSIYREPLTDTLAYITGWSQSRVDLYIKKVREERMRISSELFVFLVQFNLGKVSRGSRAVSDVWNTFKDRVTPSSLVDSCTAMQVWYRVVFREVNVGKELNGMDIRTRRNWVELVGQFHETFAVVTNLLVMIEREPVEMPVIPTTSASISAAPMEYRFIPQPTRPVFSPSTDEERLLLREVLDRITTPPFQMPTNRPDLHNVVLAVLHIVAVRRTTFKRLITMNREKKFRFASFTAQTTLQLARWYQTVILSRVGTPVSELGFVHIVWNRLTYLLPPPEFVLELLRGEYPDWLPRTGAIDALGLLASILEQADA